jgi:hypothetical protein
MTTVHYLVHKFPPLVPIFLNSILRYLVIYSFKGKDHRTPVRTGGRNNTLSSTALLQIVAVVCVAVAAAEAGVIAGYGGLGGLGGLGGYGGYGVAGLGHAGLGYGVAPVAALAPAVAAPHGLAVAAAAPHAAVDYYVSVHWSFYTTQAAAACLSSPQYSPEVTDESQYLTGFILSAIRIPVSL